MTTIRPATRADASYFARNLRPHDHVEVAALVGDDCVEHAVEESIAGAFESLVALAGGVPFAVLGVCPVPGQPGTAVPWLLGTPEVNKQRRFLMGFCADIVREWRMKHGVLFNYVHTDNTKSIRWLKRIGFSIAAPQPLGVKRQLFHPFYFS